MKTTLDDEKVKDKISEDDKKAISDKCDEAIKGFATQSSPSCMLTLAAPQEECPEACLTWEAWAVHLALVLLEELAVLGLPLRRWTNLPNLTGFTDSSGVEQRSVDSKHVKLNLKAFMLAF